MSRCSSVRWSSCAIGLLIVFAACSEVRLVSPDETKAKPKNLGFEAGTYAGRLPNGWQVARWPHPSLSPDEYSYQVDENVKYAGRASLMIRFAAKRVSGQGGVFQCVDQPNLRRLFVQIGGYIKTSDVTGPGAMLLMEADAPDGSGVGNQNMGDRRVRGTSDWRRYSIEVEIEEEVGRVCFGFYLEGPGTAWVDDMSLRAYSRG